jgi:hypothetical protein
MQVMEGFNLVEKVEEVGSVRVLTAHFLIQRIVLPGQEYQAITYFAAEDEAEMQELCRLWQTGQSDPRLIEDGPPNEIWDEHPQVETVGFFTPHGENVLEDFRSLLGIPE